MFKIDISDVSCFTSGMKRATLLLDNAIYKRAKALSKERGVTLKEVLNDLLRKALNFPHHSHKIKLQIPLYKGSGPRKGVDISDRNSLYDLMEGL